MDLILGLVFLLIGAIAFAVVRRVRGGPLFDPGPRSIKDFIEQRRTIIHPNE
jgi:hypothetical protein